VAASLVVATGATAVAVQAEPVTTAAHAGASAKSSLSPANAGPHKLNFGIAYGSVLLDESDAALAKSLNDAVAVGAKWVRTDLPWDLVQPSGPNQYNWQGVDRVVAAANARGLKLLPILDAPPYWARKSVCKTQVNCPPASVSTYAHFAAAAAARYAPRGVHAWEIWNEPNIGVWLPKPDPAAYERLLAATSAALRKADREAFVVLGGLAAVQTLPSAKFVSAFDFLTAVAKLGGTRYVNAVGFHPYSLPTLPSVAGYFQAISGARDNLVSVLQKYGTPKVSIWLTETGAQVSEKVAGQAPNPKSPAALQLQAAYATDLVQTVAANGHVGADFWYSDQDFPRSNLYFGLRAADGSPRPAFNALKTAIASCGCNSNK
jgi:hypothetical protein